MLTFGTGLIIYGYELTTHDRCVASASIVERMNGIRLDKNAFTWDCWYGMVNALDAMGFSVRTDNGKVVELDWNGDLE